MPVYNEADRADEYVRCHQLRRQSHDEGHYPDNVTIEVSVDDYFKLLDQDLFVARLEDTLDQLQQQSDYWFNKSAERKDTDRDAAFDAWCRHSEIENTILKVRGLLT